MKMDHANAALFAALAAAQAELENASKSSLNPHFKSKYADLAEILSTVRPVFGKHGLGFIQSTSCDGQVVTVVTVLTHAEGGYITSELSCVPAKFDPQGLGSVTTYLRRYQLAAMAGCAQEDDDGNAAMHNKPGAPRRQQQAPEAPQEPAKPMLPLPELLQHIDAQTELEPLRLLWKNSETAPMHQADREAVQSRILARKAAIVGGAA
jgi:hypothetical protein